MSSFLNLFSFEDNLCFIKMSSALIVTLVSSVYIWFNRNNLMEYYSVIKRDFIAIKLFIQVKRFMSKCESRNDSVISLFKENVAKNPNHVVFIYKNEYITIKDVDTMSDKIAIALDTSLRLKKGDEVALLMTSSPYLVITWISLAKLGIISALIDTSLVRESLINNLETFDCKAIIFSKDHSDNISDIRPFLELKNISLIAFDINNITQKFVLKSQANEILNSNPSSSKIYRPNVEPSKILHLDQILMRTDAKNLSVTTPKINFTDKLLYIFTSGTTGLPKASIITHHKFILRCSLNYFPGINERPKSGNKRDSESADGAKLTNGAKLTDGAKSFLGHIIYCPLPLHHSLAGTGVVSLALIHNHTVVIEPKFSVRNFWSDVLANRCTMILYVGEMARYLLASKVTPSEVEVVMQRQVKVAFGVGLRYNLYSELKERLKLDHLLESYGGTESNCQLVNLTSKNGACGFIPWIIPSLIIKRHYPALLIQVDQLTGQPLRNPLTGLCIPSPHLSIHPQHSPHFYSSIHHFGADHFGPCHQAGSFVARISDSDLLTSFEGYVNNHDANQNKVITNVVEVGDRYFISGDILFKDQFNYVYFKDRIGDTYRWKSENVSTTQVENIISGIISSLYENDSSHQHLEVVVFGVNVPHHDGKTGMVAIVDPTFSFDPNLIVTEMIHSLPHYAIPNFVRVCKYVDMTMSFKYKKNQLKLDAFHIKNVDNDPIYYFDRKIMKYNALTQLIYEKILANEIKF